MNSTFLKAISIVCFFSFGKNIVSAQNADFRNNVSFNLGANSFHWLRRAFNEQSNPGDTVQYRYGRLSTTPTFQLSYDYALKSWFSVGAALSYNGLRYSYDDVQYKGQNIGNIVLRGNRTTVGGRALFHYGNRNAMDFYSGFRLGVGIWTGRLSLDTNDELANDLLDKIDEDLKGYVPGFIRRRITQNPGASTGFVAPQFQFIPIGVRGYITDNIGIGGELAFGSPYYASINVNYRFSGGLMKKYK